MLFDARKRSLFKTTQSVLSNNLLPWISDAQRFINNCTQCGDCLAACPEKIISKGDGGYPSLNFDLGECTFCGLCAKSCNESIFTATALPAWNKKAQVSDSCLAVKNIYCRSCSESCEKQALTFKLGLTALPQIDLDLCNGCGACVSPCPTQAIEIKEAE